MLLLLSCLHQHQQQHLRNRARECSHLWIFCQMSRIVGARPGRGWEPGAPRVWVSPVEEAVTAASQHAYQQVAGVRAWSRVLSPGTPRWDMRTSVDIFTARLNAYSWGGPRECQNHPLPSGWGPRGMGRPKGYNPKLGFMPVPSQACSSPMETSGWAPSWALPCSTSYVSSACVDYSQGR